MFALVDANSFYAAAEKVFDPAIRNKPVVVLTNNDGCICALYDQAKQLGVKKFGPYYKVQDMLRSHNAIIRSSNYELYDDLSNKMMQIIGRFGPRQHVYSIDECFLDFGEWVPQEGWHEYAEKIKEAVYQELRLPVSVGISLTPTLAKVASYVAKKRKTGRGKAILVNDSVLDRVLAQLQANDIWGVGKRLSKRLNDMGITSAKLLAAADPRSMRAQFSVELERTIRELNGTPCFDWTSLPTEKKQTFSTRAFGIPVTDLTALRQSLAWHAERVAAKLRAQNSMVRVITVFAHANPFAVQGHYHKSVQHTFAYPVNDTSSLVRATTQAAREIYQPGIRFHKSGVGAIDICTQDQIQPDLFESRQSKPELMQCMDLINRRYGKNTLGVAAKGVDVKWSMKRNFLSPHYTTNWRDIPKILC